MIVLYKNTRLAILYGSAKSLKTKKNSADGIKTGISPGAVQRKRNIEKPAACCNAKQKEAEK